VPCLSGLCPLSRIVQSPQSVSIYYEQGAGGGGYRIIPLDGRPHLPAHIRQWLGSSVGRWEGSTLVWETSCHEGNASMVSILAEPPGSSNASENIPPEQPDSR
jgi:hypothetical protein